MKRSLRSLALLCSFALFLVAGLANAEPRPLTFVASHAELYAALEAAERGTIGSVAISEKYMQEGTSRVQKNQLRGLMQTVFSLGDRAVYLYGSPLDRGLAEELLDMRIPPECGTPIFVGKLIDRHRPAEPVHLCGMGGDTSDAGIRKRVEANNDREMRRIER